MTKLNLPDYTFRTRSENEKEYIFDTYRKKFVALTPEEWVRQNLLKYLTNRLLYPEPLISVEHELRLNTLSKRCDAVVFNRKGIPAMIIECKAPTVKITQKTFEQIALYNLRLKVSVLLVSNGLDHYCFSLDFNQKSCNLLKGIPDFEELLSL